MLALAGRFVRDGPKEPLTLRTVRSHRTAGAPQNDHGILRQSHPEGRTRPTAAWDSRECLAKARIDQAFIGSYRFHHGGLVGRSWEGLSLMISRRRAIKLGAGILGAGCLGVWGFSRSRRRVERPNVVFILTDDHRWNAMSCMGHPLARTPNIDRLAAEGALFENSFTTMSLCCPSRASVLTGQYPHTHGVLKNGGDQFNPEWKTFPRMLQEAGYRTALVGKWHLGPAVPQPGFDYWVSFTGQGKYVNPVLNDNGTSVKTSGYITDLLTDYSVRWMAQQTQPFCLFLSHKACHSKVTPAARHRTLFEGAHVPEPPNWRDTLESKPVWQRAVASGLWRQTPPGTYDGPVPDAIVPKEWEPGPAALDYYRVLCAVDEGLGRLMDQLDSMKAFDSTTIILTGDNGTLRGAHGLRNKRCMYEESIRVPLVIRHPQVGRRGIRPPEFALNIDMAPTILDMAGVGIPPEMQGRSLVPVLAGRAGDWRRAFLYESFWQPYCKVPTIEGVRTEHHSLATYPGLDDLDELYDLRTDPHQLHNLAADPAHQETRTRLLDWLAHLKKETGFSAQSA